MPEALAADYALSISNEEAAYAEAHDRASLDRRGYWTGWKRRHWPADVVRPGVKFYGFDKRPDRRCLSVLLRVTAGDSFNYTTKRGFSRGVNRIVGGPMNRDDPHYERVALPEGGPPCTGLALRFKVVRFVDDVDAQIPENWPQLGWRKLVTKGPGDAAPAAVDLADLAFAEGSLAQATHVRRERNPALRRAAVAYWKGKQGGSLACVACGFDFGQRYGSVGDGFIEMHHLDPLATGDGESLHAATDLVPVCSNCHRMIHHRAKRPLSIEALKNSLRPRKRGATGR